MAFKIGDVIAEKYRIESVLGEGAMGSVFSARDTLLGRRVAIKTIRIDATHADAVARFTAEARHTSMLAHPHNVRVYELGQVGETLYLVMQLVDGVSLGELWLPLPADRASTIVAQIAGALGEAHGLGLIHRDIKPANVMVSEVDQHDFAHVLDYGIAKLESVTQLTAEGTFIGTIAYAAPEQISGGTVDARADVYSLGVLLYELLVGDVPFSGTATEVVGMKLAVDAPSLAGREEIPPALAQLTASMLARDPDARPPSMAHVRERLKAIGAPHLSAQLPAITPATRPLVASETTRPLDLSVIDPHGETDELVLPTSRPLVGPIAVAAAIVLVAGWLIGRLVFQDDGIPTSPTQEEAAAAPDPPPVAPPEEETAVHGDDAPAEAAAAEDPTAGGSGVEPVPDSLATTVATSPQDAPDAQVTATVDTEGTDAPETDDALNNRPGTAPSVQERVDAHPTPRHEDPSPTVEDPSTPPEDAEVGEDTAPTARDRLEQRTEELAEQDTQDALRERLRQRTERLAE